MKNLWQISRKRWPYLKWGYPPKRCKSGLPPCDGMPCKHIVSDMGLFEITSSLDRVIWNYLIPAQATALFLYNLWQWITLQRYKKSLNYAIPGATTSIRSWIYMRDVFIIAASRKTRSVTLQLLRKFFVLYVRNIKRAWCCKYMAYSILRNKSSMAACDSVTIVTNDNNVFPKTEEARRKDRYLYYILYIYLYI